MQDIFTIFLLLLVISIEIAKINISFSEVQNNF